MSGVPVARVGRLDNLDEIRRRASIHFLQIYKLAIVFFALSTLVDTGSAERKIAGALSLTMVMMILVTAIGLVLWRTPRDRVVLGCMVLIGLWVWAQLISGQTWRSAIIVMSVLVFALVISGVRWSHSLFWYQIGCAFIGPLIAAIAFYLGFWTTTWTGRQTFLEFNTNGLGYYMAVGFTIGVALVCHVKGAFRGPIVLATLLVLPPLWHTGSRSGLALAVIASTMFLGLRARRRSRVLAVLGVALVVAALMVVAAVSPDLFAESVMLSRFSEGQLAHGQELRLALILSGLEAFSQRPWLGHGMDAPRSLTWLAANMTYSSPDNAGVATHNGYVDYLIMGGLPLAAVFLVLHLRVGGRLWRAIGRARADTRDVAVLTFCLFLLLLGDVLKGDAFGKLSWWLFGIGLQFVAQQITTFRQTVSGPST